MADESLVEQAARRLVQLRGAVYVPARDIQAPARDAGANAVGRESDQQRPAASLERSPPVQIDLERLGAAGFVTPDAPRSRIADQFRILKRPLLGNAAGKGAAQIKDGNLIMVTSAVPGEGKTFCSINLAISIALELDRSVLLVDADVAKPSMPGLLGIPAGEGLLDILQDESLNLGRVLRRTNVAKLSVLTSGRAQSRATELLASDAMARLLAEMASRYADRIIIFDSPPLLAATEAPVLASHMGQIVMVVHAESTLQSDVRHALATIEASPIKLMVLNQVRTTAQSPYGNGYGYGYGYGNAGNRD